ncbi:ABC transporter permease [uncultured Sphingomonas sp.]|uniref:ABC transporter permease n=1 Tax=uncultured Sphingomonas sp. TaxID=158754 RepID=UPI0035CB9E37
MPVALRLALRDLRRGGRGLWLLALCLFLGVAGLAGIGSFSAALLAGLAGQARATLGGDLEMRVSQRQASVAERAAFAAAAVGGRVSETVRMRGMADPSNGAAPALVDLRGVDGRWPMVGRAALAAGALANRPHGLEAVIAPALAERLGVRVGDALRIGDARLRIVGLLTQEPDVLGEGFRLGPPVLVDLAGLDATGLVQPGSLYDARYRLLLPPGTDAHATGARLAAAFPSAGWSSRTVDEAAAPLRRGIDELGQFLLLVGLAALAIAGVGVGSGVSAWAADKTGAIATLKVLGARSGMIAAIYGGELALVAAGASVAGLAVGAAVPWIVARVAGAALPVAPRLAIYPAPLAVAAALGLMVAALFALAPLARARAVPAATLLRGALAGARRPGRGVVLGALLLAAGIVALAVLTASDRRLAGGFVVATAVLVLGLWLVGVGLRALLTRLPRPRRPLARLALANLHRPGAPTERLVVALGLGFSLFVALAAIDTSLGSELASAAPAKAPRFFAADLQPEDEASFRTAVTRATGGRARIEAVPSLRGAIVALKGVRIEDMTHPPESWVLRGDRTITWSGVVPPRNRVVAGRWWPADYRGPPLVSIDAKTAVTLGLKLGDTITIAVLGVDVPARIAALREVDWGGLGLNFAIVFSPGYIEEAPHSLVASVYAPAADDGAIARDVARALPALTMVRVGDVIGQLGEVIARVIVAVRSAAAVTVAAGIAVLIGAVAASARARRYDAVILKLLGATKAQVLGAQAIEYALLAALLALVALGVGGGAGWYVVTHVFALAWAPDWGVVGLTLAVAVLATLGIGVLGSLPALRARPAAALRSE